MALDARNIYQPLELPRKYRIFFCKIDDSIPYFRTRQTAAEPYMWSELTNDTPLLKGYSFNCLQCFVEATCVQFASTLSKASNAVPAVANTSNLGTA